MKLTKTHWIIGIIVLVAIFAFSQQSGKEGQKLAGTGLTATRAWSGSVGPKHVLPSSTITATYTPATMNYFTIIETPPAGWTSDKTASPDGKIRTTADGATVSIVWTAPATVGTYTFNGQYSVYPDTVWTGFTADTVSVCSNHASSSCSGGKVYWYTSCSDIQDVKDACTATACGSFAANTCSGLIVQHARTCYTPSCPSTVCVQTPYTDTQTDTATANSVSGVCKWQCTGGVCQQNTPADTDYNGCVADTEFPFAVYNWKQITGGVTDANFPSIVSGWKSQTNC